MQLLFLIKFSTQFSLSGLIHTFDWPFWQTSWQQSPCSMKPLNFIKSLFMVRWSSNFHELICNQNRSYRWIPLRFSPNRSFQAAQDFLRCNNIRRLNWVKQDHQLARYKCEKLLDFRHLSFDRMRIDELQWLLCRYYILILIICRE